MCKRIVIEERDMSDAIVIIGRGRKNNKTTMGNINVVENRKRNQ
jgi:hypothetical protein